MCMYVCVCCSPLRKLLIKKREKEKLTVIFSLLVFYLFQCVVFPHLAAFTVRTLSTCKTRKLNQLINLEIHVVLRGGQVTGGT